MFLTRGPNSKLLLLISIKGTYRTNRGFSPYTIVRQLRDGRYWLRCLRTSSPLEGYHHHLNRAQDSMAKCAGPELQNASMRLFQFFWTLEAAITANIIPYIWHSEVHLRYRLQGQEQGRAGARPGFLAARPGWARSSCFVEMPRPGRARSSWFFEMSRACRARSSLKSGKNRAGPGRGPGKARAWPRWPGHPMIENRGFA